MLFAELALELQGQSCFFGLADQGLILVEKHHPSQLLGDGAGALLDRAALQVGDHSPADANDIHAVVLVEAAILRGDEGLLHQLWHLANGHLLPGGRPQLLQHLPIGRKDRHRAGAAESTDAARVRQQSIDLLQQR